MVGCWEWHSLKQKARIAELEEQLRNKQAFGDCYTDDVYW
jgi:hypothetical protein